MVLPSTRIYDRNGTLLYQIADPNMGVNHVVALDDLPDCMIDATIATEDANFYSHPGVDIQGVIRALWINVKGGEVVAGGSTITQQVARTLLLDPEQRAERTLQRKLREGVLAVQLTQAYSRDDILALYLNQTYYGHLAYGVEAAARAYFAKGASELTLAECAMLAGLPQAPASYDPLSDPDVAKERQRVVLDLMVKHGTNRLPGRSAYGNNSYSAFHSRLKRRILSPLSGLSFSVITARNYTVVWKRSTASTGDTAEIQYLSISSTIPTGEPEHALRGPGRQSAG
jgi:membrane peptidoglycan carboxypeptidase